MNNTTKAVVKADQTKLTTTPDTTPITPEQEERFGVLETQIEDNYLSGFKLAAAFAEIRDKKLYRANYKTFKKYCQERWEYSRSYCERLADVDGVLKDLKEYEGKESYPRNEQQARVFVPLNRDQRIKLFEAVQADTKAEKVTAALFDKHKQLLFHAPTTAKSKPAKSKESAIDVESSPVPNPSAMKKLVVVAEQILKRVGASKKSDEKELAGYLRDIIKLAKPPTSSGKANNN